MQERLVGTFPDPEKLREEYSFGGGYALRWMLYEHTSDGINFHNEAQNLMRLEGHEAVLDVGCGQGVFLKSIESAGHQGPLVGLDNNNSLEYAALNTNACFIQGNASCYVSPERGGTGLPLHTDSFDIATALFMLYHVSSPESTLRELSRVVRPSGKIVVATSGPNNKQQHRRFESEIGNALGISKPARYTKTFTSNTADELLPQLFRKVDLAFDQRTTVHITADDMQENPFSSNGVLGAYISSIKSMSRQYGRSEQEQSLAAHNMNDAIREVVLPEICRQIKETGSFVETIHRSLYICENDK